MVENWLVIFDPKTTPSFTLILDGISQCQGIGGHLGTRQARRVDLFVDDGLFSRVSAMFVVGGGWFIDTVDGSEIRRAPVEVGKYPVIYRVLAPSQVVVSRISEHDQQ